MKRSLLAFMFVLLFASCKENAVPAPAANTGKQYPALVAGIHNPDGTYSVQNADVIKQKWQKRLYQVEGIRGKIISLDIVKTKTVDDSAISFFMLVAKFNDGQTTLATPLIEKKDGLWFDEVTGVITACYSKCSAGCSPQGIFLKGQIQLVCSECKECSKSAIPL